MEIYTNSILQEDNVDFRNIDECSSVGKECIDAIRVEALETFLKPSESFNKITKR